MIHIAHNKDGVNNFLRNRVEPHDASLPSRKGWENRLGKAGSNLPFGPDPGKKCLARFGPGDIMKIYRIDPEWRLG